MCCRCCARSRLSGHRGCAALELDSGNLFDHVDQLIDGDGFVRAKIDWFGVVTIQDHANAFETIVDVHERPSLVPVTPNLDAMEARGPGANDFPTDGGRSLLTATFLGALGGVSDVWSRHDLTTKHERLLSPEPMSDINRPGRPNTPTSAVRCRG